MFRRLVLHLIAYTLPLLTTAYLAAAPYPASALALMALAAVLALDRVATPRGALVDEEARWPFEALLYPLAALHIVNLLLMLRLAARSGLSSPPVMGAVILIGAGSAYSAVVVAHEFVHRTGRLRPALARLLLWTALYDRFFIEHVPGHHRTAGTAEDPLTARFDESYARYLPRAAVGELRNAWHRAPWSALFGALAESGAAVAIALRFGVKGLVVFLAQAAIALLLIGTVNYLQHWGVRRSARRPHVGDSWDTDALLSHFLLPGLARHSSHHRVASRPYERLEATDASPKLPYGYVRMVALVLFRNGKARGLLAGELQRKGLGPFRG